MTHLSDLREIVVIAALTVMLVLTVGPAFMYGIRKIAKQGVFFLFISCGFLWSMATKPPSDRPSVQWDDYIVDNGTHYATNGVTKVGVDFRWNKTNLLLPDSQALYISSAPTNSPLTWTLIATTTVGAHQYSYSHQNPQAYKYFVWHDWIPPTPVHTNGVWLGTVIEKAKGTTGVDKMIIIHGQLMKHGKVIAP